MDSLTQQQRAILELEQHFWLTAGEKEDAIRGLGISPVRYYQLLNQIVDSEAALARAAVTVNRLHRIRSANRHCAHGDTDSEQATAASPQLSGLKQYAGIGISAKIRP
ncbi:DUF3263 domain-containing protein [Mycobacterium sp. M26]|uniref:DUF3263 domain-containing protein n=1 Tax=Mycobacterium sp. M26 TaxID=1762962 RepID=UPI0009EAC30A|nr:DUF3263 domain-containing protein [Mycobacterium sp. M26]